MLRPDSDLIGLWIALGILVMLLAAVAALLTIPDLMRQ